MPIRACKVDVGEDQAREIVCGTTDFTVSDLVMVTQAGTMLPGASLPKNRVTQQESDHRVGSLALATFFGNVEQRGHRGAQRVEIKRCLTDLVTRR
jgi:hypothetical protein